MAEREREAAALVPLSRPTLPCRWWCHPCLPVIHPPPASLPTDLGIVIKELAEKGSTLSYRNSCLTELLKPGGCWRQRSWSGGACGRPRQKQPARPAALPALLPECSACACPPSAALGGGSNEVQSACSTLLLGCISPLALHAANTRSTLEVRVAFWGMMLCFGHECKSHLLACRAAGIGDSPRRLQLTVPAALPGSLPPSHVQFLQAAGTVKNIVKADVQMMRQQELEAQVEQLQRKVRRSEGLLWMAAQAGRGQRWATPAQQEL